MNRGPLMVLTALAATVACSTDGALGPEHRAFDFTLRAPRQIPTKAVVEIEARITDPDAAVYPITFTFEKANVGLDFVVTGEVVLARREERIARLRIPILMDPRIRVTARESSVRAVTVSRTVQIDVLEFP